MSKTIYKAKYQDFLEKLREHRISRGISQVELAERMGVTQSYISKWERAERRLDMVEVLEYCKAVNLGYTKFCKLIKEIEVL